MKRKSAPKKVYYRNIGEEFSSDTKKALTEEERDRIDSQIDRFVDKVSPTIDTMELIDRAMESIKMALGDMLYIEYSLHAYGSVTNGLFEKPQLSSDCLTSDLDLTLIP